MSVLHTLLNARALQSCAPPSHDPLQTWISSFHITLMTQRACSNAQLVGTEVPHWRPMLVVCGPCFKQWGSLSATTGPLTRVDMWAHVFTRDWISNLGLYSRIYSFFSPHCPLNLTLNLISARPSPVPAPLSSVSKDFSTNKTHVSLCHSLAQHSSVPLHSA